jgi:hypothetical protein
MGVSWVWGSLVATTVGLLDRPHTTESARANLLSVLAHAGLVRVWSTPQGSRLKSSPPSDGDGKGHKPLLQKGPFRQKSNRCYQDDCRNDCHRPSFPFEAGQQEERREEQGDNHCLTCLDAEIEEQ